MIIVLNIFTIQESNKLTSENITSRLSQEDLASKNDIANFVNKTDFDDKLKNLDKKNYFKKNKTFPDNSVSPSIKWWQNSNFSMIFKASCWKQKNTTFTYPNTIFLYLWIRYMVERFKFQFYFKGLII